ncbi:MAG: ArsR/SmtB family transcription factor [Paracoccaceae bacterium]
MTNLTKTFSALSDQTRLRIFETLIEDGEQAASQFIEGSGMSAPAISRHLKVLREAGLVEQRVEGTHRYYSARPLSIRTIADWTQSHRAFWDMSLDRLEEALMLEEDDDG